jgi:SpoIID/LytB domain protein
LSDSEERELLDITTEMEAREWIESEPEVYCNPDLTTELPEWSRKNFRWIREFTIDEMTEMIAGDKNIGKLINIIPLERGASGRIYKARFEFEHDSMEVNGELAIRMLFKPALRSACFVADKVKHGIIVKGAGWGHGVGMCQSGAVAQAKQGKDFNSILNHYYREAELINLY